MGHITRFGVGSDRGLGLESALGVGLEYAAPVRLRLRCQGESAGVGWVERVAQRAPRSRSLAIGLGHYLRQAAARLRSVRRT